MVAASGDTNRSEHSRAQLIMAAQLFGAPDRNKSRINTVVQELRDKVDFSKSNNDTQAVRDGLRVITFQPEKIDALHRSPTLKAVEKNDLKAGDIGIVEIAGKKAGALADDTTDAETRNVFERVATQFLEFVNRMQTSS